MAANLASGRSFRKVRCFKILYSFILTDPLLIIEQPPSISETSKADAKWVVMLKVNYNRLVQSWKPLDERMRHFATRTITYSRRCSTTENRRDRTLLPQCIRSRQCMGLLRQWRTLHALFHHSHMAFLQSTACKGSNTLMSVAEYRPSGLVTLASRKHRAAGHALGPRPSSLLNKYLIEITDFRGMDSPTRTRLTFSWHVSKSCFYSPSALC